MDRKKTNKLIIHHEMENFNKKNEKFIISYTEKKKNYPYIISIHRYVLYRIT